VALIGGSDTGRLLLEGGVTGTALTIGGSDTGGIVTPPPIIFVLLGDIEPPPAS